MSNEIKNQVQETEVEADGELNEEALMSVAGGATTLKAAVKTVINQLPPPKVTVATVTTKAVIQSNLGPAPH